jgi:hypothetical protein
MTEEIDPEEVEYDEKNRIYMASKKFAKAMLDRMLAKYDAGLRGWDNMDNKEKIYEDMLDDAIEGKYKKMVDIANRAMMLWLFDKDKSNG